MKIKKEHHDKVITVTDPFIPGGVKHRLGDLKAYEVRNLYRQGFITDDLLEPKKANPSRTREEIREAVKNTKKKNDTRKDEGEGEQK